ncbi:MAG: c-type cytochrome, partial [Gemmatimonadota bacterium]
MGRWTRIAGFVVLGVALLALGVYGWAALTTRSTLAAEYEAHEVDFPVPFPLTADERAELDVEDEDEAEALARDRAVERGRHLLESRYACAECHGEDLGGGVMVDAFPLGSLLGPNLTGGEGGAMGDYTPADWDRIVRHGILPDGQPAVMPSEDFLRMSDRELSDIVAYIRSLDPVDNRVPRSTLGPLGKVLVAT